MLFKVEQAANRRSGPWHITCTLHSNHAGVMVSRMWLVVAAISLALAMPSAMPLDGAAGTEPEAVALDDLVARADRPPVQYRALRHLEANSATARGWLEAWTEFDPAKGFSYSVVAEGGSGRVRNSVLRAVLNAEKASSEPDECRRGALSVENYQFQAGGPEAYGAIKLLLIPRRKESRLIDGTLFVTSRRGEPLRLEGQLAKSPSFWVRSVNIAWRY